ncbi:hypothetical protein [Hymenobacter cellulosivorans]|uniref:Lipoprotein n=1 Tax=Hymenobacter cellulosivorans TaxID=2932249 RepID=A0ABY4FAD4_9BACT|nr:hypothetical protein [Hymenobacter cellulosivorans]UOQ53405.1 hypothetical protein MUN80_01290 [Hymenobacter cellulosivorans]
MLLFLPRPTSRFLGIALTLAGCTGQPDTSTPPPAAPKAAAAAPSGPAQPATTTYAGEYRWGAAAAEEAGGILTVYPESDSTVLFQLDANDGAPAYHLINVLGRATLRGKTAYYSAKAPEDEHGCRLRIAFTPAGATVASVPGYTQDCLFGGNLTADGTYRRVSQRVPAYVISGEGDTLYFAHLPPDQLQYNQ